MSSFETFWSIPPIQDAISSHLTRSDYWNCVQVSKLLHQTFMPFLWKNLTLIDFTPIAHLMDSPALSRHRHLVKVISIYSSFAQQWSAFFTRHGHGAFPALLSMKFDLFDQPRLETPFDFIQYAAFHPTLTQLCFHELIITPRILNAFETTLSNLIHLKEFDIKFQSTTTVDCLQLTRILASSVILHLEKLEISHPVLNWPPPRSEWHQEEARMIPFRETRVKEVVLYLRPPQLDEMLNRFLRSCSHLRRLKMDTSLESVQDSEALGAVLQSECLGLKTLSLEGGCVAAQGLKNVLSRCPPLVKLEIRAGAGFDQIYEIICERHAQTLESLDLFHGARRCFVRPRIVFAIAHACTSLKSLRALIRWPRSPSRKEETLKAIQSLPWRCVQLRTLSLHFYPRFEKPVFLDRVGMDLLFEQIGRMRLLSELDLYLDYGGHLDLTESFLLGFRTHLVGLENMRYFSIVDCGDRLLTEEEEGMVRECWRGLKVFRRAVEPPHWD